MSSIRFEKPHSLSYQPNTRFNPLSEPVVSNIDITRDSGRALRSEDTRGLSVNPIIEFNVGCSVNNLASAAEENGLSVLKEKSIADTLGVGTVSYTHLTLPTKAEV